MRTFFLLLVLLCFQATTAYSDDKQGSAADSTKLHRLTPQSASEMQELFKPRPNGLPFLSSHRGGPCPGFPENCLETFEHTLQHTPSILEVDPRYSKDGVIVLMHDETINRTTNGTGKVKDHTLAELKKFRLKDNDGKVTDFQIPTLDEAFAWAKGKTILVLDQKDVNSAERARQIELNKAELHAMMIVSSFKDVQSVYALNQKIMMEVMMGDLDKAKQFDKLGVSWKNVVPFVGHVVPEDLELYKFIHEKGASCMIGTSRNLDRKVIRHEVDDIKQLEPGYREYLKRGADIIETDIPTKLGPMLFGKAAGK